MFNSVQFALLLPFTVVVFWLLPKGVARRRFLLAISYLFYAIWDIRFLALIVASTAVDYTCGVLLQREQLPKVPLIRNASAMCLASLAALLLGDYVRHETTALPIYGFVVGSYVLVGLAFAITARLQEQPRRRALVKISVVVNLALLAAFKYADFFLSSAVSLAHGLGLNVHYAQLGIVLPVGLSFYTFQTLSYTIDVYRNELTATTSVFDFSLYVSYFPQLVAGPIERGKRLLPRLRCESSIDSADFFGGIHLILLGLVKKVAVADVLVDSVQYVFGNPQQATGLDVWLGAVFFAIQIVCDFSGYTDIARGSSKLLGIDLMRNFRSPYLSTNPKEFWQRWHISLSTWLRDYLYIPLGGNRQGAWNTRRNIAVTMLLGGLWHGAAWNFVLWGAFHAVLILGHKSLQSATRITAVLNLLPRVTLIGAFFLVTCLGWLLFRVESVPDLFILLSRASGMAGQFMAVTLPRPGAAFFIGLPLVVLFALHSEGWRLTRLQWLNTPVVYGAAHASLVLSFIVGAGYGAPADFVYFQF